MLDIVSFGQDTAGAITTLTTSFVGATGGGSATSHASAGTGTGGNGTCHTAQSPSLVNLVQ